MKDISMAYRLWLENLKEKDHFEDLGLHSQVQLQYRIFQTECFFPSFGIPSVTPTNHNHIQKQLFCLQNDGMLGYLTSVTRYHLWRYHQKCLVSKVPAVELIGTKRNLFDLKTVGFHSIADSKTPNKTADTCTMYP